MTGTPRYITRFNTITDATSNKREYFDNQDRKNKLMNLFRKF